jgi:hypothetical protein
MVTIYRGKPAIREPMAADRAKLAVGSCVPSGEGVLTTPIRAKLPSEALAHLAVMGNTYLINPVVALRGD